VLEFYLSLPKMTSAAAVSALMSYSTLSRFLHRSVGQVKGHVNSGLRTQTGCVKQGQYFLNKNLQCVAMPLLKPSSEEFKTVKFVAHVFTFFWFHVIYLSYVRYLNLIPSFCLYLAVCSILLFVFLFPLQVPFPLRVPFPLQFSCCHQSEQPRVAIKSRRDSQLCEAQVWHPDDAV